MTKIFPVSAVMLTQHKKKNPLTQNNEVIKIWKKILTTFSQTKKYKKKVSTNKKIMQSKNKKPLKESFALLLLLVIICCLFSEIESVAECDFEENLVEIQLEKKEN